MAGQLCEEGSAIVREMAGTIAYTVDSKKADTSAYSLQLLTVASNMETVDLAGLPSHLTCEVDGHRGCAGHVLLTYPSGGMLLVSAGHWLELSHIGGSISEETLVRVTATSYGEARAEEVKRELLNCASGEARKASVQTLAPLYVQQSPPCSTIARPFSSAP